jgi:hypothetical protein
MKKKTEFSLIDQIKPILDESISLGVIDASARMQYIQLAAKDFDSLILTKAVLQDMRVALCAQFDRYASEGTLEQLKERDRSHFNKLWMIKFGTAPKN